MPEANSITEEIWREIEFEFRHRSISRTELSESLGIVRHYQQKLRLELGQATSHRALRHLLTRQLQFNEMLVTLLQQVDRSLQQSQREIQRLQGRPLPEPGEFFEPESARNDPQPETEAIVEQLKALSKPEALWLDLEVSPSRLPLIGPWLTRARLALHRLSFFYVARFTARQATVNQVYGETLLHLLQTLSHQETGG